MLQLSVRIQHELRAMGRDVGMPLTRSTFLQKNIPSSIGVPPEEARGDLKNG